MKIPATLRWKSTGKTLGQGGQGTIFEATDSKEEFPGTYALKVLTPGKPASAYVRFSREVEATKSLDHPSIIKIFDHSDDPQSQFQFYVMELVPNATSLKNLIVKKTNPYYANPANSIRLFIQIAAALQVCETQQIVHRDLSPANILITPDLEIKLIDFGLCQFAEGATITLSDEGVGTPNYMAPECESGAGVPASSLSDLYSVGKILWSAISNQMAFSRESPAFDSKAMKSLFPMVPNSWHLHHVFEKTLRHSPKDRFQDCGEALMVAMRVGHLISAGFPPLELINEACPLCGWGRLGSFEQSHSVFGNPNPQGIHALQCNYCGYCFPVNIKKIRDSLAARKTLT